MTAITTYRPKTMSIFNEMDKMMDSLFTPNSSSYKASRFPAVDVIEEEGGYKLSVELPGYGKDDVEIKIDNNLLTISAAETAETEKKSEEKEEVKFLIRERNSRNFTRTFVLPKEADKDNIEALFKDGLLVLNIRKIPKAQPKTITIKAK